MSDRINRNDLPMLVNTGLRSELSRSESDLPVYTLNEVRSANSEPNIYLIDVPGYQIIAIQLSDRMKKGYMKIDNEVISPSESGLLAAMKTEGRISSAKLYLPNIPFIRVKNESKFDESEPSILNYRGIGSDDIINYLNSQDTEFDYLILDKSNALPITKLLTINRYLKCNLNLSIGFNLDKLVCLTDGCDIVNGSKSCITLNPGQFYDENNPYAPIGGEVPSVFSPKGFNVESSIVYVVGAPIFPNDLRIKGDKLKLEYDSEAEEIELYSSKGIDIDVNKLIIDDSYCYLISQESINIQVREGEDPYDVEGTDLSLASDGESITVNCQDTVNNIWIEPGTSKFKTANITLNPSTYSEFDVLQFLSSSKGSRFNRDNGITYFDSWDLNLTINPGNLDYSSLIASLSLSFPYYNYSGDDDNFHPTNSKIIYKGTDPLLCYFDGDGPSDYDQYSILYGLSSPYSISRTSTVDLSEVSNAGAFEDISILFMAFNDIIVDRSHVLSYDADRDYGTYEFGFPTKFIPSQDMAEYLNESSDTNSMILRDLLDNSFYITTEDYHEQLNQLSPSDKLTSIYSGYSSDTVYKFEKLGDGLYHASKVRLYRSKVYRIFTLAVKSDLRFGFIGDNTLKLGINNLGCKYSAHESVINRLESVNSDEVRKLLSDLDGSFDMTLDLINLTLTIENHGNN